MSPEERCTIPSLAARSLHWVPNKAPFRGFFLVETQPRCARRADFHRYANLSIYQQKTCNKDTNQTKIAANQKNVEPQNSVVGLTDSLPASRAMTYTHCMRARYSVRDGQNTSRFGELGRLNETNDTQTDRQLK